MTPERMLLDAVRVLHTRGFESLVATPTFILTGQWRCVITHDEDDLFVYSSAQGWDYFAEGELSDTAEELADALASRVPGIAEASQSNAAYAFWYAAVLDFCEPNGVFFLRDQHFDAYEAGFVRVSGRTANVRFPLPPA